MKYNPIAPLFFDENITHLKSHQPKSDLIITSGDRKTRFDKTAPMKFPVTEDEHRRLRWMYQTLKTEVKAESITHFFTMLVRFGFRHPDLLGPPSSYKNTDTHKTVKPNQVEKEMLTRLSIQWNLSERKTLYGVVFSVLSYIEKGGRLAHEEVQPFRPSK
ncbi:hypothetical protein J7E71_19015 [Mesobacillus foraminis]|uniref:hypothetical protein n=1 Tax=Mesobacillus foraminis TaxID=279826 RepID=UPI001BEA500E|nr:hypothetical protein [Mesobacillus foraminis]MBT2757966.1 hypothetical protein [Mesobacillus foraminis]